MADRHQPRLTDTEELFLFGMAVLAAAAAVKLSPRALAWLLAHRVLLPRRTHPLVAVPGLHGAGLDLARLALLAAAVLAVAAPLLGRNRGHRREAEDS